MCSLHLDSFHETFFAPDTQTRQRYHRKRKLQANITDEHRQKIFNRILANQIHSTLKESYTMIKWGLSQEWKDCLLILKSISDTMCINKLEE